jgi:ABC-type transport system involved in cytochrome c biogenesis permease subunit
MLGVVYVLLGVFSRSLDKADSKNLVRMIYGITCFAILFSFVGTVLGGIWADQSWGRFGGWAPKENVAVLIVLVMATAMMAGPISATARCPPVAARAIAIAPHSARIMNGIGVL